MRSALLGSMFTLALACNPTGETRRPVVAHDASVAREVASIVEPPPSPAPSASSAPPPEADASEPCLGAGRFDLAALLASPACALRGDDPRARAVAQHGPAKAPSLAFEVRPTHPSASSGAAVEVELVVTNTGRAPVEVVLVVRPDEWGNLAIRSAKDRDGAWETLRGARGPSFDPADKRAPWWAAVRIAPGATGHTRIAARATVTRVEHLAAPPGMAAPYAARESPAKPGTYDLRPSEPLSGRELHPAVTLRIDAP